MLLLIWLALISLVFSLLLTPVFRTAFVHFGFVDRPDHIRKLHRLPTPPAGGFPIVLSYLGAVGLAILILPDGPRLLVHNNDLFWRVLPSAAIVFVVGFIDDVV